MTINKIWFISDLHFGIRSNSLEWLQIQKDYFNNWLIPLLKKEMQKDDILFVLGDVFDNRQSLNLLVLNTVLEIFEEIAKIIPIHIILGNHDTFRKNSNDINSVKILQYINNVIVYQEPKTLVITKNNISKTLLIMPWRSSIEEELKTFEQYNNCNYLFCHTDIQGLKYNKTRLVESGSDKNIYNYFQKVFSGHIHYRQIVDNIVMIGCPIPLTRSDANNQKGIYVFDPFNDNLKFFENKYSPKFLKYHLEDVMEMTLEKFNKVIKNNFVDILVNQKWSLKFSFTDLMDNISDYRKINIISIIDDNNDNLNYDNNTSTDLSNFNIMKLTQIYVDLLNYSTKIKLLTAKKINELYNKVLSGEKDDRN